MRRRSSTVDRLEDHPNLPEVLGVLAQLAHVSDEDLPLLAQAWGNSPALSQARDRALSPDSPLVIEVLAAFDAVAALFEDDLRGEADWLSVDPAVTVVALKAVRDAIAAAYARPHLSRGQHAALMRPWRSVYPQATVDEPDLGPQGPTVKALLQALPRLAERCHDHDSAALYERLVDLSFVAESDRSAARETAFQAAVVTRRRRTWALVRRSAAEGLGRTCRSCPSGPDTGEAGRVLQLCLDAACGLLVADAVPDDCIETLTLALGQLIPSQRGGSTAGGPRPPRG